MTFVFFEVCDSGNPCLNCVHRLCSSNVSSTFFIPRTAFLQEAGEWAGSGVIEVPSQENDPNCTTTLCDIGRICGALLDAVASNGGDNVAALAKVSSGQHAGRCLQGGVGQVGLDDVSLAAAEAKLVAALHAIPTGLASAAAAKAATSALSWPYQTCTEWAFYQTCEYGSRCPFVQGYHNLSQSLQMCQVLFDKDQAAVQEQVL